MINRNVIIMMMPILLAIALVSYVGGTSSSLKAKQNNIQAPLLPAIAFALMDPADDSDQFNTYLLMDKVDGIALRLSWDNIQPTSETSYNWIKIDNAFALAQSLNKKVTLHILSSVYGTTPDWVYNAGAESFTYYRLGRTKTDPIPWDSVYLSKWSAFLTALSDHLMALNYLSNLEYISIGAPVPEMSIASCKNRDLNGDYAGKIYYDRNKYLNAWKSVVLATHNALPSTKKLLPAPVAHICFKDNDGKKFYESVFRYAQTLSSTLFNHYATDLKASGSDRLDQIDSVINEAPVALQYTWSYTDDLGIKLGGTLREATCTGILNFKGTYFEVYKSDLSNPDTDVQSAIQAIHDPLTCS